MEWAEWKPIYEEILRDFRFDPLADIGAAKVLATLFVDRRTLDYHTITGIFGRHVSICGPARTLEDDISGLSRSDTIISAGSATSRLMKSGVVPHVIVTDLDGEVGYEVEASSKGSLVFVHAHGDNIDKIRKFVPQMKGPIIPTVQCRPFGPLYNFGGFTDGDRAYLIAKHFGADSIEFRGWDLSNAFPKEGTDPEIKRRKLSWAHRIIDNH